MKSKLNSVELFIYSSLWSIAIVFSIYKLFQVQNEILKVHHEDEWADLKPGWTFLSRYRDVSDTEWNTWKLFFHTSWYHMILQFPVSELLRFFNKTYVKYWYICSSAIYITVFMGIKKLILISLQPAVYLMVIFCGGGKISIWLLSLVLLGASSSYSDLFWYIFDAKDFRVEELGLLFTCITWSELRCISYAIDYVDENNKNNVEGKLRKKKIFENVIDLMSYVLYLSPLCTGPLLLYEDFEKSLRIQDVVTERLSRFIWDMALFLMYTFMLELGFHYIYFSAMQSDIEIISKMPAAALWGGALWIAAEFHMKYVISYGIASAFARMDNVDAPPTPRCVFRIHLYSQMWRYFDVGLYMFLVKYIYKPCQRQISKSLKMPLMAQKMAGSLVTFVFIFIWHGINREIFVWFIFNFLGIVIETLASAISTTDAYKQFKKSVIRSEQMELRFLALACTPLLIMSAIVNFYLVGSSNLGFALYKCFMQVSWSSLLVTVAIYSCCHASIALETVSSRTDVKSYGYCKSAAIH